MVALFCVSSSLGSRRHRPGGMLSHAMVTLVGSNFDTFWFAVAILELDGTVQETFPFGDGRDLFNPCSAMDPMIQSIWRTKIFESSIFVIHKV